MKFIRVLKASNDWKNKLQDICNEVKNRHNSISSVEVIENPESFTIHVYFDNKDNKRFDFYSKEIADVGEDLRLSLPDVVHTTWLSENKDAGMILNKIYDKKFLQKIGF